MSRKVQSNLPENFGEKVSGENHLIKGDSPDRLDLRYLEFCFTLPAQTGHPHLSFPVLE